MSYINKAKNDQSPFDIVKISGNNTYSSTTVFDTPSVSWLSFDSSSKEIVCNDNFYSEACFSPNSNAYGIARVTYGISEKYHLRGYILPESNNSSAGSLSRGDDIAINYGSSCKAYYDLTASFNEAPNVNKSSMKVMRL